MAESVKNRHALKRRRNRKFADSPLEGDGFEPSVPQIDPARALRRWSPPICCAPPRSTTCCASGSPKQTNLQRNRGSNPIRPTLCSLAQQSPVDSRLWQKHGLLRLGQAFTWSWRRNGEPAPARVKTTSEPKVSGLSAGGSEIRTLGPRAKEWAPCRLASHPCLLKVGCWSPTNGCFGRA